MSEKLYMATSFGWVKASKSTGEWKSSGMSDFTIGYKLPVSFGEQMAMAATYRYAPIAVSGEEDKHMYRGVWEQHLVGARGVYKVSPTLNAVGSAELGYVVAYLNPVDDLPSTDKHETNGGNFTVGGGCDWALVEKGAFAVGPRLYAGFGSFSTFQLSAAASFVF
jgi:hypothetical protein